MNIEYARLTPTPAFVRKENKSAFWIRNNEGLFKSLYSQYAHFVSEDFKAAETSIQLSKDCFESKVCDHCGGDLRYIQSHDFWGCSNYKEPGLHRSFSGEHPLFYGSHFNVDPNWVTNLITKYGFKGKVLAKDLLEWFIDNDMPDIRQLYGLGDTLKRINNLVTTKRRSVEQEKECLKFLQSKYQKVLPQQCITFKEADKKESFCIPDFICSDNNSVFVVDAKLDYVNDQKMAQYVELVKFILTSKNDLRPVYGSHIMYEGDTSPYMQSAYPLITIPKP